MDIHKIQGFCTFSKLYDDVFNMYDTGIFVEVGVWLGQSAAYMADKIKSSNKDIKFYCVDLWQQTREMPQLDYDIYDMFLSNMNDAGVGDYFTPIRMDSTLASKQFADNSIDFVYVDAFHSYEAVKSDVLAWLPKVKSGGIIAGHDVALESVQQAVNEIFGVNKWILVADSGSWMYKVVRL